MTISTLIDSNVLIDVLGPVNLPHRIWSLAALRRVSDEGQVVVSAIVWAEIAEPQRSEDFLAGIFARFRPLREAFPFEAAYAAGLAHRAYVGRGGKRERTLPDFLIGAHADARGHRLLTRDPARYRTYFPSLDIIAPDTHP